MNRYVGGGPQGTVTVRRGDYDAARRALLSTVRRSAGIGIPVCFFARKQNALLYINVVMSHGEQYKY